LIRIYLLLIVIVIAYFALRRLKRTSPDLVAKYFRTVGLGAVGLILLYFFATGRLNGLFAGFGLLVAFVLRLMPTLIRYGPQLHLLWTKFSGAKQSSSHTREAPTSSTMTIAEAYQVLGLQACATEDDIIGAHRKLMQKLHPDRGGSDYLAAKINSAKKILLSK